MMSNLRELIPGAQHWPHFVRNRSEQFEARVAMLSKCCESPSLFFDGMAGSRMPIAVAHGEGYAEFADDARSSAARRAGRAALRRQPRRGRPSAIRTIRTARREGITGLTTPDGRFTILMPHPERVFRTCRIRGIRTSWGEDGPWMRMFRNARKCVG